MDNRIIATVFALVAGSIIAAEYVAPEAPAPVANGFALAIIYEDAYADGGAQTADDVAAFAANGLSQGECDALSGSINRAGGFAACLPPLVELDADACKEARTAPTDANLERCYGEPI